ncbi:MAG: cellulase family glycosylhydrolase [Sphingobacteriales bacterium]
MKKQYFFKALVFLITVVSFFSCKKATNNTPEQQPAGQLAVNVPSVNFTADGGSQDITITSNAGWILYNPASSWLQTSIASGKSGSTVVHLTTISQNATGLTSSGILEISSSNGQTVKLIVTQLATIFPTYNTSPIAPDMTGMTSTAVQQAANMKLGINLGNTLEAPGGETGWGSPVITENIIKFMQQSGFNSIRLPCSWDYGHIINKGTEQIDPAWLARVKQVVGYCVNNNMYVLLNIHWDGGWLVCTPDKQDSVNAKQKALWEQIATAMRDFDGHLMFASENEPTTNDASQMTILESYHQTFVNAVRSTGGRNAYRILVVQGSSQLMNAFPTDPAPNRMMYEEHNYTPWQFTEMIGDQSWGKMFYYWGAGNHSTIEPSRNATWGEETDMNTYFQGIKQKFVDKGIPVIMGEYAAIRRSEPLDQVMHQASVDYWITFNTKQALVNGLKPFYWDTGGVLNRQTLTVNDQRTLDAIIAGGK